ncbi:hypothetical protein [Kaistia nematophila]|uniref:Uncharacterized protein n=1 Tax=Kaistia nematophila TaxID=2994654 RepID=A0A9X3IK65_9HYPH|nr:hypothetical protein [Kaistia nematophila]MCX5568191.1 hypothetical protein [Kaistia nematophila]
MEVTSSSVIINSVIWISSLRESEQGVTRRIIEELDPFFHCKGVNFVLFEPQSADHLRVFLDQVEKEAREDGLRPIIHIDTHGGKDTGIHIVPSGEDLSWEEATDRFKRINVATKNNLCVVSLACYGFHIVSEMSISDRTPFYILAAPENTVSGGFVESTCPEFYRYVFTHLDIMGAYRRIFGDTLKIMHCEEVLLIVMAKYVRAGTIGKAKQERVEALISTVVNDIGPVGSETLKAMRKVAKEGIKPTQELLERYIGSFLMGRPVAYDIEKVKSIAATIPDPYADGKRKRPMPGL